MARDLLIEKFKPNNVNVDGDVAWTNKKGLLHRNGDNPAFIFNNGSMQWFKNGLQHRDGDKPAIIHSDGQMEWWENGKRHRGGDRPSIIYSDGRMEWWVHDEFIKREK